MRNALTLKVVKRNFRVKRSANSNLKIGDEIVEDVVNFSWTSQYANLKSLFGLMEGGIIKKEK